MLLSYFSIKILFRQKISVVYQGLFVTYLYVYVYDDIKMISFQCHETRILARVMELHGIGTDCPVVHDMNRTAV